MLGKTHIATGISASLLIIQPKSIPELIASITGGAIGGLIVDIDCKKADIDKEKIFNLIIDILMILFFISLDFFSGNGICHFIISNWGLRIIIPLLIFLVLTFIGYSTKHRTFTHSLLALFLFGTTTYILCPIFSIPFSIGYLSHILFDLLNKRGLQLFFPLKRKFNFNMCNSDGIANMVIFWVALLFDLLASSLIFAHIVINTKNTLSFYDFANAKLSLGLNRFQFYLIIINIISLIGFEISFRYSYREQEAKDSKQMEIQLEFETWLLNFIVFIGGGLGMFISLIIHYQLPSKYNGNWWSFCYSSIIFWLTIYSIICNPFNFSTSDVIFLSLKNFLIIAYIVFINITSGYVFHKIRNKRYDEYSLNHTLLLLLGALGGTLGAISVVLFNRKNTTFSYVSTGFFVMLISQVLLIIYLLKIQ